VNRNTLLLIGAIVISMAFFYWNDHRKDLPTHPQDSNFEDKKIFIKTQPTSHSALSDIPQSVSGTIAPFKQPQTVTAEDKLVIDRNFAEHLKDIANCLKVGTAVDSPQIEPTYDNLLVSLRPALGDLVVQMDDWTQMDLQSSDGSKKRIRTEVNYESPNNPTKYVQLFNINDQGLPEMQSVDQEKAINPTDDYINYLKGGASIVLDERGSRAYFPDGEELVLVERAGKIESMSLTKGSKTVSCTGLDAIQSNCQCLE